jgi:hypothetical protein
LLEPETIAEAESLSDNMNLKIEGLIIEYSDRSLEEYAHFSLKTLFEKLK